jgi:hypothetical protein
MHTAMHQHHNDEDGNIQMASYDVKAVKEAQTM